MIVDELTELSIVEVYDRGVPNRESIAISVNETTNMGRFGVMLGISSGVISAVPVHDQLFWFGDGVAQKGDWIFLYTGSGNPRTSRTSDGLSNIYTCFWGRPSTALANSQVVPILFRVDAVHVASPPINKPQLALSDDTQ